ncbi:MFS transporter [Paucilactobacillus kaifaensis]|uniref:MFS transporter n=1 Tax=Paucilactobacillus kaifaensis TaxID=2559921 RepID=UPI0010F85EDA|nr:MFS transporter [Paucilactobacillus kaifaensis]
MLSQVRRWSVLSILGLFFFMVIVDGSIVTIAIPDIARDLNVPTGETNLIISVYLITICATLLLFGQFGDQFGRIRIFEIGTLIFLIGSFLAGAGHDLGFVLIGRLVQGIGASMTMANSYAIVTDIFPADQLGRAFGIEGIFISLGALAGPGLGGVILANLPWGYIFWINLPLGLICLIVGALIYPKNIKLKKQKIDWYGAITLALAAVSLYVLTMQINASFIRIVLLVIIFIGFSWWFINVERKAVRPLLNLTIFRNAIFSKSIIIAFLSFIVSYFFTILAPLYLQLVLNYSTQFTGLLLMIAPIISIFASPITGYISDHYNQQVEMTAGMVMLIIAQMALLFLSGKFEPYYFIAISALISIGMVTFGTPNNVLVMQSVPVKLRGMAGSTNSLVREFGLVLGTTISTIIFYRVLSFLSRHEVRTAIGVPTTTIINAQRWTYAVGLILLLVALIIIIHAIRKELKK